MPNKMTSDSKSGAFIEWRKLAMNKREMKKALKAVIPDMELVQPYLDSNEPHLSVYLGSFMSLDPCGRYHHFWSPNGITSKCKDFWERFDSTAEGLGGWLESGEGDPTDIYFCLPAPAPAETKDK